MKKLLMMVTLLVMVFTTACDKYKYDSYPNDPLNTRIYTLDNGLKVYMSVMKEQPRIQAFVAVKVGGKNDPAETTGLAHYFEHLMFKGTPSFGTSNYEAEKPLLDEIERLFEVYRKTTDEKEREQIYHQIDSVSYEASKFAIPNEYDKLMALIGATESNAYTTQDETVYREDIPSNQIENWVKIQADRFKHPVIRGFHTELETIYEEKNMSLTKDNRKLIAAMDEALFPHHPYGTQTVLGTQEHLKNPSITNVKAYHKQYYVPNNMAICVSGDFDPEVMIATIDKYFGDMKPNDNLPELNFQKEEPITTPIVKDIYGPEAANVVIAWRLPESKDRSNDVAEIASSILNNGQAGLMDLNINQQQKALYTYATTFNQPDYGRFLLGGAPMEGQSLDEVRDLMLAEVEKLRNGDFDDSLIAATVNQYKLSRMRLLEDYVNRAEFYVNTFISGAEITDDINQIERMSTITKQDVVAWAKKYLGPQNFAVINKHVGVDPNEQKIAAPKITPIVMNRDMESAFLTEMKNTPVKPIEPVFVDFKSDMEQFTLREGINVLYKQNTTNDIFSIDFMFDRGLADSPELDLAAAYLDYLNTPTMSAEDRARKMYALACSQTTTADTYSSYITMSGLSENMAETLDVYVDLRDNAQADEEVLAGVKAMTMKARQDAKLNQGANFSALRLYMNYGADFIKRQTLTNEQLMNLTSEQLLAANRMLKNYQHEIVYYGPMSKEELTKTLLEHYVVSDELQPTEERVPVMLPTDKSRVYMAQYTSKQLQFYQSSNYQIPFAVENDPYIMLYNQYFGGGMNSIVFQEMRESRGLAYTAQAFLSMPRSTKTNYGYGAYIATQNDKMKTAIVEFDKIINQMPESEAAFQIAKEALVTQLRTSRTVNEAVLWSYRSHRRLGLDADRDQAVFDKVQSLTLDDVKATQEKWVKNRHYVYAILGDINDLDLNYLKTLGDIRTLSQEEIFGY